MFEHFAILNVTFLNTKKLIEKSDFNIPNP